VLAVAPISDPEQARMITDTRGDVWDHKHPTWSPDGRWICYATRHGLRVVPAPAGPRAS